MTATIEEQMAVIKRFAAQIHSEEELRQKLASGKKLIVKYGIDPTAPDVHLGHTVPLRLMRQLQGFGHTPYIIVGNATALIGDPSGRDETRAKADDRTIRNHAARYLEQIAKVIDLEKDHGCEIACNDEWFGNFRLESIMDLLSKFTLQQIIERDDFNKRINDGVPIFLHELLYPLMQGYDSVAVKADIEIGGTEQLFNMMVGRDLQRQAGQEPQVVITLPILRGTDGCRRMGKSLGNYIGINESPFEMFSKILSIPDDLLREWFTLLTDKPEDVIDSTLIIHHPMNAKKLLAKRIVTFYHGAEEATKAEQRWTQQFSRKEVPEEIEPVYLPLADVADKRLIHVIKEMGLASSLNDARRLISQGAVSLFFPPVEKDFARIDPNLVESVIEPKDGMVIKVGRKIRKLRTV